MSCSSCGNDETLTSDLQVIDFPSISVRRTQIRAGTGRMLSIQSPMVKKRPPLGWTVTALVGKQRMKVEAGNAQEVAAGVVRLYANNGIAVTPLVAWYGCNLAWLRQVHTTKAHVSIADFEMAARTVVAAEAAESSYTPLVWGGKGWGILQVLLASEKSYTHERFVAIAEILLVLLADPFTGCEDCRVSFGKALEEFRSEERDIQFARKWLFDYQNQCRREQGRSDFPWEHALKANHWKEL